MEIRLFWRREDLPDLPKPVVPPPFRSGEQERLAELSKEQRKLAAQRAKEINEARAQAEARTPTVKS